VLTGLATFVVLMAGAALVVEWRLPGVIDPTYYGRLQYVRQGQAADPARARTVVFLGTSRTFEGVTAVPLSRELSAELDRPVVAANWGIPGAGFVTNLLTFRRLQRDGVRPDLMLIEVMPSLFGEDSPGLLTEALLPATRLDHLDLPVLERYRGNTRPDLRREVVLAEAGTLYSRRYALAWALSPHLVPTFGDDGFPLVWPVNLSGRGPDQTPEFHAKALAHAHGEYAHHLADFKPARCESLHELLTACRDAGVPVALLLMPEGPVYRSWYGPETWPRIQAWLDQVSAEFGAEVVNAREWMDESDFRDSHHLMAPGAARFSSRLGHEYIVPRLRAVSN
jgi:hypothetical protein